MQHRIKSYVLRAGRVSKRQQQGLDQWLEDYELTLTDKAWSLEQIFGRQADTVVEIGFGMGHSLLLMAQRHPELNYIGIEVHQAGVGSLSADLHDYQLSNVRIAMQDAVTVFRNQIEDQSLAGIQIFFPDPWHKKRHHKRRLITPDFVQLLTQKLRTGGFIHCATDWFDYAEQMMSLFSAEPTLINKEGQVGLYSPRPESRPLTKFEQRGQKLQHQIWDLIFIKKEVLNTEKT